MRVERDGAEELVRMGRLKDRWRQCLRVESFPPGIMSHSVICYGCERLPIKSVRFFCARVCVSEHHSGW